MVWTCWKWEKLIAPTGIQTLGLPARSRVCTLTTLLRLHVRGCYD